MNVKVGHACLDNLAEHIARLLVVSHSDLHILARPYASPYTAWEPFLQGRGYLEKAINLTTVLVVNLNPASAVGIARVGLDDDLI